MPPLASTGTDTCAPEQPTHMHIPDSDDVLPIIINKDFPDHNIFVIIYFYEHICSCVLMLLEEKEKGD